MKMDFSKKEMKKTNKVNLPSYFKQSEIFVKKIYNEVKPFT